MAIILQSLFTGFLYSIYFKKLGSNIKFREETLLTWRWENEHRWYEAELCFDLFGDLLLIQRWGGRENNRYGQKTILMPDFLSGVSMLFKIDQERKRRKPPYYRV